MKLTPAQKKALKYIASFGNDGVQTTGNRNTNNALHERELVEFKDGWFYLTLSGRALVKLL